ncbi:Uncharacterized protein TCAP_07250 [Tolypocladium capitatum]|uniref:Uncharacterized protein n=1 Tax=Tolypocladium capitatum TaxID=45235 RepID=A0A2K3Q170_9HYPO|nr:Uncharacterized protein TCAP_07250 [Tolypocladium capitatum]
MEAAERATKRVLVIVSQRSSHWDAAWTSPGEVVAVALSLAQQSGLLPQGVREDPSATRLLATEKWDRRIFIVFDVYHDTYNPDRAHLDGQDNLPVIEIYLSRKEIARVAGTPTANKVNRDIRAIHNATGPGSRPPFNVDHSEGKVPFYSNPRSSYPPGASGLSVG